MQPVSFTALSKRSVCGLLVLVALVLVSNCRLSTLGVEGDDDRPSLAQVIVVAPDTILPVGERMQLSVMLLDEGGNEVTGLPLAWASADAAIATVDSSGLVRAKAEGSTRLIAASGQKHGETKLHVVPPRQSPWYQDDFERYTSTQQLRDECTSRGSQCLSPEQIFLDQSIAFAEAGLSHSMRYDWTNQGCTSQSVGFPRWFSADPQDELWIEVPFRLSRNYTSCNAACPPCDHKFLFGFSSEGFGRWEMKFGGGGYSSDPDIHTGVGGWLSASNMTKPGDFNTGLRVADYTDERWHVLRVHWKHSSTPAAGDGIGEIWIDGVKGNTMQDINTAAAARFVAIYVGRNKDKGLDQGTESLWVGQIRAWVSNPGW